METQRAKRKNTKHDRVLSVETQSVTNIQVIRDEMQCGKQLEKFREPNPEPHIRWACKVIKGTEPVLL